MMDSRPRSPTVAPAAPGCAAARHAGEGAARALALLLLPYLSSCHAGIGPQFAHRIGVGPRLGWEVSGGAAILRGAVGQTFALGTPDEDEPVEDGVGAGEPMDSGDEGDDDGDDDDLASELPTDQFDEGDGDGNGDDDDPGGAVAADGAAKGDPGEAAARRAASTFYLAAEPGIVLGGTFGVALPSAGERTFLSGVWLGGPVTPDISPSGKPPILLTLALGYRFAPGHELYVTPKVYFVQPVRLGVH